MNKGKVTFSHLEYRNAKIIHLVEKEGRERFIHKKQEITKAEADRITRQHFENKERQKIERECTR